MAIDLLADFADWVNLPPWFAVGLLGMAVTTIVLAISVHVFKAKGVFLSSIVVGMGIVNWQLFYWPLWASIVTAVGFLWGMNRG